MAYVQVATEGDKRTCIEDRHAHASKTDTFIVGNSLRVHSSRLPNMERLPAERRGCQPIKREQYPLHAYVRVSYSFSLLEFAANGRIPTNQMRVVHVHAYALPPKFYCRMVVKLYLSWRDGEPLSFASTLKLIVVSGVQLEREYS